MGLWRLLTFVWYNVMAADISEKNETTPVTIPSSVVWRTVKPNELIMSEYWFVIPFAISCDQACRKNNHVFGSWSASMNLECFNISISI